MPLIKSTYHPKFPFTNTHVNTIFRTFVKPNSITYARERLELEDGDFMDLDNSKVGSKEVVIILHGLEGSSTSNYIMAAANLLNANKFDIMVVNLRGCSGTDNRKFASYHSGKTEDLESVLNHVEKNHHYETIILLGYSLGGNILLKYLGEYANHINSKVCCAIGVSVPCDLKGSSKKLAKWYNTPYMRLFLKSLKIKSLKKASLFPKYNIDTQAIAKAKNFKDYDEAFTAPANGFLSAEDYWKQASSKPYLKNIQIPTLLINAQDDTFLAESCFPIEIAKDHAHLILETPKYGGHVGFNQYLMYKSGYWLEKRILSFIKNSNLL